MSHLVVLRSGVCDIAGPHPELALTGSGVIWLRHTRRSVLRVAAGSTGYLIGLSGEVVADAVGARAESLLLRNLVDQIFAARVENLPHELAEFLAACEGVTREIERSASGSWTALSGYVRVLLVLMWRLAGGDGIAYGAQGQAASILQRFRQLVEMNLRRHWKVRDYARALGVSHDRLHAICTRELDRSPLMLIHDRAMREARLELERSPQTVEQVAFALGYRDAAHFSHFFKRHSGHSPGAYRKFVAQNGSASLTALSSWADWP